MYLHDLQTLYSLYLFLYIHTHTLAFFTHLSPRRLLINLHSRSGAHVKPSFPRLLHNGSQPAVVHGLDLHCRRRRQRPIPGDFSYRHSCSPNHRFSTSRGHSDATSGIAASRLNPTPRLGGASPGSYCSTACYSSPAYSSTACRRSSTSEHPATCNSSSRCNSPAGRSSSSFSTASSAFSAPTGRTYARSCCNSSSLCSSPGSVIAGFSRAISVVIEPSGSAYRSSGTQSTGSLPCSIGHRSEWSKSSAGGADDGCFGMGFDVFVVGLDNFVWAFSRVCGPHLLPYAVSLYYLIYWLRFRS